MREDLAVHLSGVWKTFRSRGGVTEALRGVDLEVPSGKIFGFLGPNGAGKTTTLRILTTLLPFDKGEVMVAGIDILKDPQGVRKKIGYVSQKGGADRKATGWENLLLQGQLYGMDWKESEREAHALIELLSLQECIHRFVSEYSGGQQRRLDIALGMIHKPKIIFLDEPTNGLDPQNRNNLWLKILELKERGVTIFLTSHYLDEIDALADTLAIMDLGVIVASGTPTLLKKQISGDIVTLGIRKELHQDVLSLFARHATFVRESISRDVDLCLYVDKGEHALPQILRILDQANIELETIQMTAPSLNDVFLKKTGRSLREEALT